MYLSDLQSYRAVANYKSGPEAYTAQYFLSEFVSYVRKTKLSVLLSGAAHSGRSRYQADIRDFMNA